MRLTALARCAQRLVRFLSTDQTPAFLREEVSRTVMNIDAIFPTCGLVPSFGVHRHAAHVLLASD